MEQIISAERTYQVSEVELIYRPRVRPSERPKIKDAAMAYHILLDSWNKDKIDLLEEFKVMLLNCRGSVLGIYSVSSGGLTGTIADPRLIFAAALKATACSLILAHNHPSGGLQSSPADKQLTKKIKEGGLLLDIKLLDHLIITLDGFLSFADEGLL